MGLVNYANMSYETEKYIVVYGKAFKFEFNTIEKAVAFAMQKANEGYEVSIKQVNEIVGWY